MRYEVGVSGLGKLVNSEFDGRHVYKQQVE